jgi:hypothetical protein
MTTLKYPDWICHDCGAKYCRGHDKPGHCATYHLDNCQCCGAKGVPCTEPRDYGHFKQWPVQLNSEPEVPFADDNERTLQDLVDPVLEAFNFDKVHHVMRVIDWKWVLPQKESALSVPSVDHLRVRARSLLEGAIRQSQRNGEYPYVMATGGLYARAWEDALELDFVLEQSSLELQDLEE